MQAGRALDAKVAVELGWQWGDTGKGFEALLPPESDLRYNRALYGPFHFDKDGNLETMPHYSTSWEGMGVLVEEARKQGIYLDILPNEKVYIVEAKTILNKTIGSSTKKEAPHAGCLAYLNAHGITV